MLAINLPEVISQVRLAFETYEKNLTENNVDALINSFWRHPNAVRFGANENLYGWQEILNFRQQRTPPAQRELMHTIITTYGDEYANVSTEFKNAKGEVGRQMQSWIRTQEGWRIAAAHISLLPASK
ncbi:MAG TPA: oxalurate catabolism protein HpxZ [Methylophilaceae bacterium]|jgi:hypothetical protein